MVVAEIMKLAPEYVLLHTSSRAVARRMRDRDVDFLPICDKQGRVIGTITDRDIAVRVVADALNYDLPITDVMTHEVVACRVDHDVLHAARLMEASHKSRVVVLDLDGRLAGVVSLSEIGSSLRAQALTTDACP